LTSCGTTPPKSPEPIEVDTRSTIDYTTPNENVGIVFEDNRDSERTEHAPPPTSTYKISSKTKETSAK
jgi:hypothetical protein